MPLAIFCKYSLKEVFALENGAPAQPPPKDLDARLDTRREKDRLSKADLSRLENLGTPAEAAIPEADDADMRKLARSIERQQRRELRQLDAMQQAERAQCERALMADLDWLGLDAPDFEDPFDAVLEAQQQQAESQINNKVFDPFSHEDDDMMEELACLQQASGGDVFDPLATSPE